MHEIKLFKPNDATHTVAAGQFIFQAGEPGKCAYVLLEGEAEVLVNGAVVERAKPGSLLGEMALIEHRDQEKCCLQQKTAKPGPASDESALGGEDQADRIDAVAHSGRLGAVGK